MSGFNDILVIPNSIIYIGKYAFSGSITERLVIGNGLKRIEECTFRDIGAESIEIGDSVSYMGNLAFGGYLGEVVIPPSVKEIEGNPFGGKVKQIVSQSEAYIVRNNILYSKDGKELVACISKEKVLAIPNTVEHIHPYAFTWSEVESITLPDSVTDIGEGAFYMARTKNVHLPNGIKKIPLMAFYKSKIETIVIPDSVTEIETDAFKVCENLKEVQMSHNIETIGETAFAYCMKLGRIKLPKTLANIGDKAFFCCHELKKQINRDGSPDPFHQTIEQETKTL